MSDIYVKAKHEDEAFENRCLHARMTSKGEIEEGISVMLQFGKSSSLSLNLESKESAENSDFYFVL